MQIVSMEEYVENIYSNILKHALKIMNNLDVLRKVALLGSEQDIIVIIKFFRIQPNNSMKNI